MAEIDFVRVIASIVAAELAGLRKTSALIAPLALITAETELGEAGLAVDSLELLRLAASVNEFFHLHETSVEEYLLHHRTVGAWAEIVQNAWAVWHERLTFRTSGSNREPKRCTHWFSRLAQEVEFHATTLSGTRRVLSGVPCHHIYGFIFTVLLPARLATEVHDIRAWSPARLKWEVREGDLLVAAPSLWEYLSRSIDRFDAAVHGVTSTSSCPAHLFTRLQEQGVMLTEIYGSSETGGVASRSRPQDPFALFPFWERADESLWRKPTEAIAGERFELMDEFSWTSPRSFMVGRRRDGAVQVGGINVFPAQVAARMATHPAVKECAVRLMAPSEGDRLKAYVVWREISPGAATVEELQNWIRREFNTPERPVSLVFGVSLPRNELGKLQDWAITVP